MRAYMVYEGDPHDGAALVLANNSAEAKRIGHHECAEWGDGRWIDTRVKWLREADIAYLTGMFGAEPTLCETEHLMCSGCHLWSAQPLAKGRCVDCGDAGDEDCTP